MGFAEESLAELVFLKLAQQARLKEELISKANTNQHVIFLL